MIRSKFRFKGLGVCVISMLGLAAFSASTVQAEVGANWKVNGANLTSKLSAAVQVSEIPTKTIALLTEVVKMKVKLLCSGTELIGVKLETEGRVSEGSKIKLTGCVAIIDGVLVSACEPKTSGQPSGTMVTNELKGLLVLHENFSKEKQGLLRLEPKAGETVMAIQFNTGECLLSELLVNGKLFLTDSKKELKSELVSHLFEQGPLTHLFVISDTAEHAMNIDGSVTLALTGEHSGLKWSGLPA